jgi:LacI family transcriptional regulator
MDQCENVENNFQKTEIELTAKLIVRGST